ncbi:hypothetical protein [Moraxella lacunata]|uniref:hypothetical protein n=1 Tax=Moraxella lacunata TaxID=477 RepID=UPI003EE0460A
MTWIKCQATIKAKNGNDKLPFFWVYLFNIIYFYFLKFGYLGVCSRGVRCVPRTFLNRNLIGAYYAPYVYWRILKLNDYKKGKFMPFYLF